MRRRYTVPRQLLGVAAELLRWEQPDEQQSLRVAIRPAAAVADSWDELSFGDGGGGGGGHSAAAAAAAGEDPGHPLHPRVGHGEPPSGDDDEVCPDSPAILQSPLPPLGSRSRFLGPSRRSRGGRGGRLPRNS